VYNGGMEAIAQEIRERLEELFRRCPQLHGFAVRPDRPLPWHLACDADANGVDEALDEIAQTLLELIEERPEAAGLLRGRTFARTFH
jgi:hypothetical protein